MRYIVLGMHKSGTTLIARLLHHAGVAMVAEASSQSYEDDNFYERVASYHINLALLNAEPDSLQLHAPPQHYTLNPTIRDRMQSLIDQLDQQHTDWGFKDPRTCLVFDAWAGVLGDYKLVVTFRPIEDLWHRFDYTGVKIWRKVTRCILLVQRWCEYNQAILTILQSTAMPYLVVSYRHFMQSDNDLKRLEAFIGRPIPDQRITPTQTAHNASWLFALAIRHVRQRTGLDYHAICHQLNMYRTSTTYLGRSS